MKLCALALAVFLACSGVTVPEPAVEVFWICCKKERPSVCYQASYVREVSHLCLSLHEQHHLDWVNREYPGICKGANNGDRLYWNAEEFPEVMQEQECAAHAVEANCYLGLGLRDAANTTLLWARHKYKC